MEKYLDLDILVVDNERELEEKNQLIEAFMNKQRVDWIDGKPYLDNVPATYCKDCQGWCDRSCDSCKKCNTDVSDNYNA